MEWLINFIWLDIVLLLFVITVVFLSFQKHNAIELEPSLELDEKKYSNSDYESFLKQAEFHFLENFDAFIVKNVDIVLKCYISEDRKSAATIYFVKTGFDEFSFLEFCTNLKPGGSITTNNSPSASIGFYPPDKLVSQAPWKKKALEVLHLHQALCEVAAKYHYHPTPFPQEKIEKIILDSVRRDFDYQVQKNKMKAISDSSYRLTLKGSFAMTPKVWWQMTYGILFSWYHCSDATFIKKAHRLFAYLPLIKTTLP